jgi:hypothetical protein
MKLGKYKTVLHLKRVTKLTRMRREFERALSDYKRQNKN